MPRRLIVALRCKCLSGRKSHSGLVDNGVLLASVVGWVDSLGSAMLGRKNEVYGSIKVDMTTHYLQCNEKLQMLEFILRCSLHMA